MKKEKKDNIEFICTIVCVVTFFACALLVYNNMKSVEIESAEKKYTEVSFPEESLPVNVSVLEVYEVCSPTSAMGIGFDTDNEIVTVMLSSDDTNQFAIHQKFYADSGIRFVQTGVVKNNDGSSYPLLKMK